MSGITVFISLAHISSTWTTKFAAINKLFVFRSTVQKVVFLFNSTTGVKGE